MTDMTKYRKGDLEETCLAIEKGISDGEISIHYIGETGLHPDDVKAVEEWIKTEAEALHKMPEFQVGDKVQMWNYGKIANIFIVLEIEIVESYENAINAYLYSLNDGHDEKHNPQWWKVSNHFNISWKITDRLQSVKA